MSASKTFPDDFIWGAATASYQIEGGHDQGGRGESIWDRFSHTPGKVFEGHTGDVACDHFNRWQEDITLMKTLGLQAYRFSIAWPRIFPQGDGHVNEKGLDFYDKLVDGLLEAGIKPFITLFHWDLPQALEDKGGWTNRETVACFCEYVRAVVERLHDRVSDWITLNEPYSSSILGYMCGVHAPGHKDIQMGLAAAHHHLLAHGRAVQVIRDIDPDAQIGIALNIVQADSDTEDIQDEAAASRQDGLVNRWFLDPIVWGSYPGDMLEWYHPVSPPIEEDDMDLISSPIEFVGVNYYTRQIIRHESGAYPIDAKQIKERGGRFTEMDWAIYPGGIYKWLMRLAKEYHIPKLYITENGAAFPDKVETDGSIEDYDRLGYLKAHFGATARAIRDGANVGGYFAWSLMDNFEWSFGYSKRFGLVHIDYQTKKRTPKLSAFWYRDVIKANGLV